MDQELIDRLSEKEPDEELKKLLEYMNRQLRLSRSKLKARWCAWDKNNSVFRGERVPDEADIEASENDEPMKMVVPMTYSQVMTYVTYAFFQLKQNPRGFFQFAATGNEDYPLEEPSVTLLDRDLNHNDWSCKLVQILLDAALCGFFTTKVSWDKKEQYVQIPVDPVATNVGPFQLLDAPAEPESVPVLKFEGNKVEVVSPYHIVPDMRVPLTRWKEGRFIADEQEYHISHLRELEDDGVYAGIDHVEKFSDETFGRSKRHKKAWNGVVGSFEKKSRSVKKDDDEDEDFMCITTEGQWRICPNKYNLGNEDYPVDFIITVANDSRIVRIERLNALHGEYMYSLGQFLPDQQNELSLALADSIDPIQTLISYLINSRVEAVRIGLDGKTIVDPRFVDVAGFESRSPVMLVRKSAPVVGVDKFVSQLKVQDSTASNIPDTEFFVKLLQMVTGVNENAMGQYAPGRRSASENRAANAGAASRMNLHTNLIFEQCLAPTGSKMLTNLRQGLSFESFVKIIGETSPVPQYATIEDLYEAMCPADPRALIGNEDFFTFDSQSMVEKQFLAQALQELVGALAANPAVLSLTNYDLTKLIDQIQQLRGVRNVAQYKNPAPVPPAVVAAATTPPTGPTGIVPGPVASPGVAAA